ncbi:MAG: sugar ABC transporter permease [Spirochaetales bacterium]|nr:sugar ABC transporter permease [Spirochaetales bacterium]
MNGIIDNELHPSILVQKLPVRSAQNDLSLGKKRRKRIQLLKGLAYASPGMLLLCIFRIWPMFFGAYISFFKWGFFKERFVGFKNYIDIFTSDLLYADPQLGTQLGGFGKSLLVTLNYTAGTVPTSILLSFIIAYILFYRYRGRGRSILRTIFFLPYITSQVASMMVFKWIFHPQVGIVNSILATTPIGRQQWFSDPEPVLVKLLELLRVSWPEGVPLELAGPSFALVIIMMFSVWHSVGFNTVIFLAGFSNLSKEIIDASKIDGAGGWKRIRYVILPLLSPTIFFLSIISLITSFESFNAFYVFSNGEGSPLGTTMALPLYIFKNFYVYGRTGYASALAVVLFLIIFGFTLIQRHVAEKQVHYEQEK